MRMLIVLAGLSVGIPAVQAAEAQVIADQPAAGSGLLDRLIPAKHPALHRRHLARHLRPHDTARPVVRLARSDAHERASPGVTAARTQPKADRDDGLRLAVLDRPHACDSILCPGYSMLGVGF